MALKRKLQKDTQPVSSVCYSTCIHTGNNICDWIRRNLYMRKMKMGRTSPIPEKSIGAFITVSHLLIPITLDNS